MNRRQILWSWSRQMYGDQFPENSGDADVRVDREGEEKCSRHADQHSAAIMEFDSADGEYQPVYLCTRCVRALADEADKVA